MQCPHPSFGCIRAKQQNSLFHIETTVNSMEKIEFNCQDLLLLLSCTATQLDVFENNYKPYHDYKTILITIFYAQLDKVMYGNRHQSELSLTQTSSSEARQIPPLPVNYDLAVLHQVQGYLPVLGRR